MDQEQFFGSLQLQKRNDNPPPPPQDLQTPVDHSQIEKKKEELKRLKSITMRQYLLNKWIVNVRRKRLELRKSPKRNLRIESILANVVSSAEYKLRCNKLAILQTQKQSYSDLISEQNNSKPEPEPLCPELSSLDDFMKKVSEVKSPLQR
ncbi:PREDICTED: uncharacterized protein LOC107063701 [Polistes dominula]|uniref:Uncharacterized protein LOC107063701 n=1 Tax=Polistes dominula TaxID=743375 RepID=A0ABM1HT90_POLDO|nr:PREDICTED: uncharacterized protein LOC107063701 [Polistes dominula]